MKKTNTHSPTSLSSTTKGMQGQMTTAKDEYANPWRRKIFNGSIRVNPSNVCTHKRRKGAKQAMIARYPYWSTNLPKIGQIQAEIK